MADIAADFAKAQEDAKALSKKPSNDDLLELYALFKQATAGDNSNKRPGMFDMVGGAKHDAWAKKKGLSKDDAMKAYTAKVNSLKG